MTETFAYKVIVSVIAIILVIAAAAIAYSFAVGGNTPFAWEHMPVNDGTTPQPTPTPVPVATGFQANPQQIDFVVLSTSSNQGWPEVITTTGQIMEMPSFGDLNAVWLHREYIAQVSGIDTARNAYVVTSWVARYPSYYPVNYYPNGGNPYYVDVPDKSINNNGWRSEVPSTTGHYWDKDGRFDYYHYGSTAWKCYNGDNCVSISVNNIPDNVVVYHNRPTFSHRANE